MKMLMIAKFIGTFVILQDVPEKFLPPDLCPDFRQLSIYGIAKQKSSVYNESIDSCWQRAKRLLAAGILICVGRV